MRYTPELAEELNVLLRFNLTTTQEGLKVHHTAAAEVIEAARRLHDKGLVTQVDGGYLTDLGREAAQHAQDLLSILTPPTM
ncbi:MAG: TIGR02647 family protein [Gammaproteobacteria bacterium]